MSVELMKIKAEAERHGRISASGRMNRAVTTAESPGEMTARMMLLRAEAIHILATYIFNDSEHKKIPREQLLKETAQDLEFELNMLLENLSKAKKLYPQQPPSEEDDEEDTA